MQVARRNSYAVANNYAYAILHYVCKMVCMHNYTYVCSYTHVHWYNYAYAYIDTCTAIK